MGCFCVAEGFCGVWVLCCVTGGLVVFWVFPGCGFWGCGFGILGFVVLGLGLLGVCFLCSFCLVGLHCFDCFLVLGVRVVFWVGFDWSWLGVFSWVAGFCISCRFMIILLIWVVGLFGFRFCLFVSLTCYLIVCVVFVGVLRLVGCFVGLFGLFIGCLIGGFAFGWLFCWG